MTDVLHYLFEEDLYVQSAETAEAKSQTRVTVYDSLYGKKYKYALNASKTMRNSAGMSTYADGSSIPSDGFYGETDVDVFDPTIPQTSKPYVPPTEFNPESPLPFGKDLDAPLG